MDATSDIKKELLKRFSAKMAKRKLTAEGHA